MHTAARSSSASSGLVCFMPHQRPKRDISTEKGTQMLNRFGSNAAHPATTADEKGAVDPPGTALQADFARLSGDEIERLIALCEAPALLWCREPASARDPEPFGMIA